eukprot:COSAG04_NODE_19068_length_425_cov_2.714724_1_plen_141_part_11
MPVTIKLDLAIKPMHRKQVKAMITPFQFVFCGQFVDEVSAEMDSAQEALGASLPDAETDPTGASIRLLRAQNTPSGFGMIICDAATIVSFNEGSTGAVAGLLIGDKIVKVNGFDVADKAGVLAQLGKLSGADVVTFGVLDG